MDRLFIVVPAYNEAENIRELAEAGSGVERTMKRENRDWSSSTTAAGIKPWTYWNH
jgi:hypothetical protein